jgi:hypothetical protein
LRTLQLCPSGRGIDGSGRRRGKEAAVARQKAGDPDAASCIACGEGKYEDGWREGSWAGFSSEFTRPAPWYFRTIETWVALFAKKGFRVYNIYEPLHPKTNKPASIIFDLH